MWIKLSSLTTGIITLDFDMSSYLCTWKERAIQMNVSLCLNSHQEEEVEQRKEELHEEERKAKRRTLGNIRFIGELFKLKVSSRMI